ncbi:hypothetical protein NFI95_14970 [Acetobacteraceae bacterium KSS8]|uniref:Uncharacterized protein n=1 Tax=Endosaccharibacter trunci TaxID=2812733 RepID=A0ABT1WA29_9PROT|nr:hypothetical protein [Acetobacteraceae bacterium KSS8]
MSTRSARLLALSLALSAAGLLGAPGAQAMSMKECSVKYQEAKKSNTLNGADWKSFRAAQCGSGAPVAATDTPGAAKSASTTATPAPAAPTPAATTPAAPESTPAGPGKSAAAAAPVASGNVVFPTSVDPKYASLSAGKARMKTCVDQYHANKADGGNGGLKWIQKGGGYYSECTKKLKGS